MRPPWLITNEELKHFMKTNRMFRMAWEDMASVLRARDVRGVKQWVFAMGWLCCAYYYRKQMLELTDIIAKTTHEEIDSQVRRWELESGLAFFMLPKG